MSRVRYPASPLERWLNLQKTHHVTATQLVHWRADCCLATNYNIHPIVVCAYRRVFSEQIRYNIISRSIFTTKYLCALFMGDEIKCLPQHHSVRCSGVTFISNNTFPSTMQLIIVPFPSHNMFRPYTAIIMCL
jgi:hypothetical protein